VTKKEDSVEEAVQDVVEQVVGTVQNTKVAPKKRRLCRYPGCTKVIKSQGHCQRHGARAKRCKVEGCDKQAQVGIFSFPRLTRFSTHLDKDIIMNSSHEFIANRVPMTECASDTGRR